MKLNIMSQYKRVFDINADPFVDLEQIDFT